MKYLAKHKTNKKYLTNFIKKSNNQKKYLKIALINKLIN